MADISTSAPKKPYQSISNFGLCVHACFSYYLFASYVLHNVSHFLYFPMYLSTLLFQYLHFRVYFSVQKFMFLLELLLGCYRNNGMQNSQSRKQKKSSKSNVIVFLSIDFSRSCLINLQRCSYARWSFYIVRNFVNTHQQWLLYIYLLLMHHNESTNIFINVILWFGVQLKFHQHFQTNVITTS